MKKLALFIALFYLLSACERPIHPGYTALDKGIFYHVEAFGGEGKSIAQGDMVIFSISVYEGESKGWSSPVESMIQCDTLAQGLKGLLDSFEEEDSVSIRIAPDMIAYDFGSRLDTSSGYGAIRLRIKEVYPSAQWNSDQEEVTSIKKAKEQERITAFLEDDKHIPPFEFIEGQYQRILEKGSRGRLPSGVEARVIYECYLLDGTFIYSQSAEDEQALWYNRGLKGALIPGMERVVLTMDMDDKVEVIMPSEKAYGTKGVAAVGIEPWTPLRFVIRLELASRS